MKFFVLLFWTENRIEERKRYIIRIVFFKVNFINVPSEWSCGVSHPLAPLFIVPPSCTPLPPLLHPSAHCLTRCTLSPPQSDRSPSLSPSFIMNLTSFSLYLIPFLSFVIPDFPISLPACLRLSIVHYVVVARGVCAPLPLRCHVCPQQTPRAPHPIHLLPHCVCVCVRVRISSLLVRVTSSLCPDVHLNL